MNLILLQAEAGGGYGTLIMFGLMFVVMYFFMIRPQMKKNKEQQAYREAIKKGDKIVTTGGIHGKIAEIKDTTFIIETEAGGRLKINKTAVSMDASQGKEEQAK